jgi:hypothetical protein
MTAEQPLVVEFEVGVAPGRAFELWTERTALWWPASHTMSGDPEQITFEPRAGGRIVEHASGAEHAWGEVLVWDPPTRLRCLWHPFFDRAEATELEITFGPTDAGTSVRLEQRGFERLGEKGAQRRDRTSGAWAVVGAAFAGGAAETDA